MKSDELVLRTKTMIEELNIKATRFADAVDIGRSTLYSWWAGSVKLSDKTLCRIEQYLNHYGF